LEQGVQTNARFRKPGSCLLYSRDQLASGIFICTLCHKGIHKTYDEMTLGKHFASPAQLLQDETLQRHFAWVARQKVG
jgi:hypothetical protein